MFNKVSIYLSTYQSTTPPSWCMFLMQSHVPVESGNMRRDWIWTIDFLAAVRTTPPLCHLHYKQIYTYIKKNICFKLYWFESVDMHIFHKWCTLLTDYQITTNYIDTFLEFCWLQATVSRRENQGCLKACGYITALPFNYLQQPEVWLHPFQSLFANVPERFLQFWQNYIIYVPETRAG